MLDSRCRGARGRRELLTFDSRWFSTVKLPYAFNPEAHCPGFMRFLYRVLEIDPETRRAAHPRDRRLRLLQEWFGYNLLNDGRFQRFLIMVGEGANGKSVSCTS